MTTTPDLEALTAPELLRAVLSGEPRACITCSFQASGIVLLDLLQPIFPRIPVLFVDTGLHHPETYAYRDQIAERMKLRLVNVRPDAAAEEEDFAHGPLCLNDPERCCQLRKVLPLNRALARYDLWITGLRREGSPTRAGTPKVGRHVLPGGKVLTKVSPLADWSWEQVLAHLSQRGLPIHPLHAQGYPSIGCSPCTSLPSDPANPRSGRFQGRRHECGMHLSTEPEK